MCFDWNCLKKMMSGRKSRTLRLCEGRVRDQRMWLPSVSLCCICLQVHAGHDFPSITIKHVWGSTCTFLKLYHHPRSEGTRTWMLSFSIAVCGTSSLHPAREERTCETLLKMTTKWHLVIFQQHYGFVVLELLGDQKKHLRLDTQTQLERQEGS